LPAGAVLTLALIWPRVSHSPAPPPPRILAAKLDLRDSLEDGTPDFMRLDSPADRDAFRHWFTWLAEAQYFQPPAERPAEIGDCAALLRYAYRETLRVHHPGWAADARLPVVPAFEPVTKYERVGRVLSGNLFRVRSGSFRPSDLNDGAFAQFADAKTLWRLNCHRISRRLDAARPGDLLFFRRERNEETFHSMIYLGPSHFTRDGQRYVVYHTGPEGDDPGEMRRFTVEEMLRFPRAEWRPLESNGSFLGVYRWNILCPGGTE
jgi:uncharacterized protein YfaT (DUF1175 family)